LQTLIRVLKLSAQVRDSLVRWFMP